MKCRCWHIVFLIVLFFGCVKTDKKRDFYFQSGCLYLKAENYLLAEREFQNTVQVDPEFSEGYRMLCQISAQSGRWQDALHFCLKMVKLCPKNDKDRQLLSQLYLINHNVFLAKKLLNTGLETSPEDPAWQFLSAMISFKENRPDTAMSMLKRLSASSVPAASYETLAACLTQKQGSDPALIQPLADYFSFPFWAMTASALSNYRNEFSDYFGFLRGVFQANQGGADLNELTDDSYTVISSAASAEESGRMSAINREGGVRQVLGALFSSPLMIVIGSLMLALILFNRSRFKHDDPTGKV